MEERIDLAALDTRKGADAGFELQLKHPATGQPLTGWVLRVRGYDSDAYRRVLDEHQRRRLDRLAMGKRLTVEEMADEALEADAVLVAGWPDRFDLEGRPFEYSEVNARSLLHRFAWMREQIGRAAGDRGNFLPGSTSN